MKTFQIPVAWRVCGNLFLKANSKEEAIQKAYGAGTTDAEDVEYIDDSWHVQSDEVEEVEN